MLKLRFTIKQTATVSFVKSAMCNCCLPLLTLRTIIEIQNVNTKANKLLVVVVFVLCYTYC